MENKRTNKNRDVVVNILKIIGLILLTILPINLAFLLTGTQDNVENISALIPWLLGILWLVFAGFLIRWMWHYYLKIYPDERAEFRSKDIGLIIGLFIFLRIVAIGGTLLNEYFTGNEMTANDAALASEDPLSILPIYFLVFQLAIGIVASIIEELVFRGIFSHLLFDEHSFWLPGIISSTVFSFMHGFDNLITFSLYFIMGMTLFYAYKRRNTIKDSILLHVLNNSLAVIIAFGTYIYLYFQ